jgi:3-hydroxybutyryl-CoA dehydrogenase
VPEDPELKRAVFAEVEKMIGIDVPLASNTSALPITLLQAGLKNPKRFIGMHWAAPCQVNRFLEVIRGDKSGDAAMDAAVELAKKAGREPGVVNKDIPGFVVNRLAYAVYREALHLMDEGVADAQTIDSVFCSVLGMWGSVMGPMRWIDLSGFALYAKVMERLFPTLDHSTDVPRIFKELIESGAKGADPKTGGRGFYEYTPEQVRQWHKLLVENGWKMYKLRETYSKDFPEINS